MLTYAAPVLKLRGNPPRLRNRLLVTLLLLLLLAWWQPAQGVDGLPPDGGTVPLPIAEPVPPPRFKLYFPITGSCYSTQGTYLCD